MKLLNKYLVGVALTYVSFLGLASSARAADIPKGTYIVKTSDGAVWELNLDGKGKFNVSRNATEAVVGTYKVSKDQIEFTDENGPLAEQGDAKTGTYKWKFTHKKLEFTIIKDEADGRSQTLSAGPWEMKE